MSVLGRLRSSRVGRVVAVGLVACLVLVVAVRCGAGGAAPGIAPTSPAVSSPSSDQAAAASPAVLVSGASVEPWGGVFAEFAQQSLHPGLAAHVQSSAVVDGVLYVVWSEALGDRGQRTSLDADAVRAVCAEMVFYLIEAWPGVSSAVLLSSEAVRAAAVDGSTMQCSDEFGLIQ